MNGILIPQNIFVGDTAQFLFPLSEQEGRALVQQGLDIDIPLPLNDLAQNELMSVNDLRLVKRDNGLYLQITFIPWEIGDIAFPAFPLLRLKRALPSVYVSSLLETGQQVSLQPPKPPLLLPGTDYLLYGAAVTGVGILLLIGTGIWLVLRNLRKRTPRTAWKRLRILKKRLKQLHKEARRLWKRLKPQTAALIPDTVEAAAADVAQIPVSVAKTGAENAAAFRQSPFEPQPDTAAAIREWYAAIDRSLREYLSALAAENDSADLHYDNRYFSSATYTELTNTLVELFAPEPSIPDLFRIFYTMLEKQRFGSDTRALLRDYTAVSQDILKKIPYIAEKTEKAYTALQQAQKTSADAETAVSATEQTGHAFKLSE